jgi:ketosteroid isomerase-like protein
MLDVFIPDGAISNEAENRLLAVLTDLLLRSEGADPTDPVARSLTYVWMHRPAKVAVGGAAAAAPRYRVVTSVPEGAYDERRRLEADITEAVLDAEEGAYDRDPLRVFVFPNDVGYVGHRLAERKVSGAANGAEGVVLAAIAAVERRDSEALLDLYHDDIEFHDAPSLPYGGVVRGKAAAKEHMHSATGWAATWGPLQPTTAERAMSPRVVASAGELVVVEYRQRALAGSGDRFDAPVIAMYRVRDGLLAGARMFHFDVAAVVDFLDRARHERSC